MDIISNIQSIKLRIENACIRAKRDPSDVKLVAVTKTVDIDRMKIARDNGLSTFGENKVQEIVDKYPCFEDDIKWHMIGHLQTNKVKYIADKVVMIHSMDSLKLAEEINKRFKNSIDVLIEVNIGKEPSKFGVDPDSTADFINFISGFGKLNICGLMTVAPAAVDMEEARVYFKEMKYLFDSINEKAIPNVKLKYLSMGMTNGFEVAIEEGANIVRIGTGIFGSRDYSNKEV
jgi:pyridoxal phosphate enzyme (YggS family)